MIDKFCIQYNRPRDNKLVRTRLLSLKRTKMKLESLSNRGVEGSIVHKNDLNLPEKQSQKAIVDTNIVNHWKFVSHYDKDGEHIRTDCVKNGKYIPLQKWYS